jgi:DNA-binding MarR family transcriptional regulator
MEMKKNLTQLERLILEAIVEMSKPVKQKDLSNHIGISVRSTRHGLSNLMKANIVSSSPDLTDLRSFYYMLNSDINISKILSS